MHFLRTLADFQSCIQENALVVVDFTASWCGPCRFIAPKFEEMSHEFEQVVFVKVDVDDNEETSAHMGVQAMPTFMFFKHGKKVGECRGANEAAVRQQLALIVAAADLMPSTLPVGEMQTVL